ncbi:MAG: indole-3-glycerol phosphate synthase TrpC [Planctomycetes bacterium]|nr:indole-3-glycerol phosphate synthase TrpC [Planctomycetota bacterium]
MARTILHEIIETKRKEVADARQARPLEGLIRQCRSLPRCRNFYRAVSRPPLRAANLIAEVKKASPSAGVLRADFDPVAIARTYEAAGASALSVLTDTTYFQGRLEYLSQIRQAVALPLLRKDFIIDPYQVYEARAAGADAILLIAACLATGPLTDLLILASQLSMTCLIEVHDADELLRVRSLAGFPAGGYVLLGINNRDLKTFTTDIATTLRLAELVDTPDILVSESGIHTRADVERLAAAGVRGILVGESLMRSDDIAAKIDELLGPAGS